MIAGEPQPRRRLGLKIPVDAVALPAHRAVLALAEECGFTDAWSTETDGPDAFAPLMLAAAWTRRLRLGTGVAGALTRGSALLCQQAAALQEASAGRAVVGIGASSRTIVEGWNGCAFDRPTLRVADRVDDLRSALAGRSTIRGFRLERPPAVAPPIFVAALGPVALRQATRIADGVVLNLVPRSGLADVVAGLGVVRPGFEVAAHVTWYAGDPDSHEVAARWTLAAYASVPAYRASLGRLGWQEALAPVTALWRAGRREDAAAALPRELLDDVYVRGEADALADVLRAYAAGGVTLPIVEVVGPPAQVPDRVREAVEAAGVYAATGGPTGTMEAPAA